MKLLGKSIILSAAAVAAVGLVPVTSASASTPQPKESGWVTISLAPGTKDLREVKNVGGGTWSYGRKNISNGRKTCWSNYVHNGKRHSATTILGSANKKVFANPGYWANTSLTGKRNNTCHAYWATY